jgi:hypothetical protein
MKISTLILVAGIIITIIFSFSTLGSSSELATALIRMGKQIVILFYSVLFFLVGMGMNAFFKKIINDKEQLKAATIVNSIAFVAINFFFCQNDISISSKPDKPLTSEEIASLYDQQDKYKKQIEASGKLDEYNTIYQLANDSLAYWVKNFENYIGKDMILDSTVFVNKDFNRCVLYFYKPCPECSNEVVNYLNGVKIADKWYFFRGSYHYLYKNLFENVNKLNKEHFHISVLKSLTKQIEQDTLTGKYNIQESFFKYMEPENQSSGGYGSCFECKTFEDYVLFVSNMKYVSKTVPFNKSDLKVAVKAITKDSNNVVINFPLKGPLIPSIYPYEVAVRFKRAPDLPNAIRDALTWKKSDEKYKEVLKEDRNFEIEKPLSKGIEQYLIIITIRYNAGEANRWLVLYNTKKGVEKMWQED